MALDTCTVTPGQELCSHQYIKNLFLVCSEKQHHWGPREQPSKSYKYPLETDPHIGQRRKNACWISVPMVCPGGGLDCTGLTFLFRLVTLNSYTGGRGCWLSFWLCWDFSSLLLMALCLFSLGFSFVLFLEKQPHSFRFLSSCSNTWASISASCGNLSALPVQLLFSGLLDIGICQENFLKTLKFVYGHAVFETRCIYNFHCYQCSE